jgi:hypothetical protein
MEYDKKRRLES